MWLAMVSKEPRSNDRAWFEIHIRMEHNTVGNRIIVHPCRVRRSAMPTAGIAGLNPEQRRFLLLDNGAGPFAANLLINGAIAWLMFRHASHVPMWGQNSIAGD